MTTTNIKEMIDDYVKEVINYYNTNTVIYGDKKQNIKITKECSNPTRIQVDLVSKSDFMYSCFKIYENGDVYGTNDREKEKKKFDNLYDRKKKTLFNWRMAGEECQWPYPYVEKENVKWCGGCDTIKNVSEYYKSGYKDLLQSKCKKCSCKDRNKYNRIKPKYVKKKKGFDALDEDTRKSVLFDLHIKKTKKSIAKKHNINYQTFLRWIKKDTFPDY